MGLSSSPGRLPSPSLPRYVASALCLVGGILLQYVPGLPVPSVFWESELFGAAITYGPGLVAFFVLVGPGPLRNFVRRGQTAVVEGMRWYGILGMLSLLAVICLTFLYVALDPRFDQILSRTTNVENVGSADPWLWIGLSFPIGIIEETLFRGFLFGGALFLFGTKDWKLHALWTSLLFAGVHLYYAQTYLEVSPLYYVQLFLLGLAFAYIYYYSGGNLAMIAFLHGFYDASSFAAFLPGVGIVGAAEIKYGFLGLCGVVALGLYLAERDQVGTALPTEPEAPPWGWSHPPVPAEAVTPLYGAPGGPSGLSPGGASSTSFAVPYCSRCGAIVMGNVAGFPERCPRCGNDLPSNAPAPVPPSSPPGEAPSHPVSIAHPRPTPPPPSAPLPPGRTPWDRLAPGAWPP